MTRFVRFQHGDTPAYGVVEGEQVAVIEPHPFTTYEMTGEKVSLESLRLLAPVIPSKVVCVGKNYTEHAAEMNSDVPEFPLLFLKPSSSVIGPGDAIRLPTDLSDEVHHEAELAVVIGALLQRVDEEVAMAGVLGYTAANDVSARDFQRAENQWFRAKAFDTFCPLGPAIATGLDPSDLKVRSFVDDELRQDGTTADLVFDVPRLISEISHVVTLLPGDVVLTGTPAGVGVISPGQRVRIEVEGVGSLENPVVDRQQPDSRPNGQG